MTSRYEIKKFRPLVLHLTNSDWREIKSDVGKSFKKCNEVECLVVNIVEKSLKGRAKAEINWFLDYGPITEIVNKIYPTPHRRYVPLTAPAFHSNQRFQCYCEAKSYFSDDDAKKVVKMIELWREAFSPEHAIESIARRPIPDAGGEEQLKHLASLAYLGDFNTIMDYQEAFRNGKSLNLVPMIKKKNLEIAVDIALERA